MVVHKKHARIHLTSMPYYDDERMSLVLPIGALSSTLHAACVKWCCAIGSEIDIAPVNRSRTHQQNKLIHAIFRVIAEATGHTLEEIKMEYVTRGIKAGEYPAPKVIEYDGEKYLYARKTSACTVEQISRFTSWLIMEASVNHPEIIIPTGDGADIVWGAENE